MSKYHGMIHATRTILTEEGVQALWSVPIVRNGFETNGNDTKKVSIL